MLGCVQFVVYFFFKQKTAYEMRISDWSSDGCSSDLAEAAMQKIFSIFDQTVDDDPAIGAELDRHSREEAALIMSCPHCGPELTARWGEEDRKTFSARHGKTGLHKQVDAAQMTDRKSKRLNSSH